MLSSDFKNYPFLTGEEFAEVSHHLDRRYCQATLGPVRRQWKLRVCSALNTAFELGPEYNTYIQIVRSLEGELDDGDLSKFLDNFSFNDPRDSSQPETEADSEMMEAEEADQVRSQLSQECLEISKSHSLQGCTAQKAKCCQRWPCQVRDTSAPDVPSTLPVVQSTRPPRRRTGIPHRHGIQTPGARPVQGWTPQRRRNRWHLSRRMCLLNFCCQMG